MSKKPLSEIVVTDLTRILAGPYCTMILKNLGAEVIKVERPDNGDEARSFGPFVGGDENKSAYFMSINAGKKSLALVLKTEGGKKILSDLIERSDVLVENYRPGTLSRLGFSEDVIYSINPKIVYTSVSGFGHTGPESERGAFDMIIQALSGIISITGTEDGRTARVGTSISDIVAGMYAAIGILAALINRGKGETRGRVDIAMFDSTVAILENAIARYQVTRETPRPLGKRHPSITPFGSFKTKDSEIIIAAGNDRLFGALCDILERPDLKDDERFKTNDLRTQNVKELSGIINSVLSENGAEFWLEKMERAKIPSSVVNTIGDLFEFDQVYARNMMVPIEGEDDFMIAGNPIKLGGIPDDLSFGRPPALGEHNDEIMRDILGYSTDEIRGLYEAGVLSR